jgi:hypothetical protein
VSKIASEDSLLAARRNLVVLSNMQRRDSNLARRVCNAATSSVRSVQGKETLIAGAETILIPEATEWALSLAQATGKTLGPLSQRLSIVKASTIMKLKTSDNQASQRRHHPSCDKEDTTNGVEERSDASSMSDSNSSSGGGSISSGGIGRSGSGGSSGGSGGSSGSSSGSSSSSSNGCAIVSSSIRHPSHVSPTAGDHGTSGGDTDQPTRLFPFLDDVRPPILHLLCRRIQIAACHQLYYSLFIHYLFIHHSYSSHVHHHISCSVSRMVQYYLLRYVTQLSADSLTHHSCIQALTHSLNHSLTHSLTRSPLDSMPA